MLLLFFSSIWELPGGEGFALGLLGVGLTPKSKESYPEVVTQTWGERYLFCVCFSFSGIPRPNAYLSLCTMQIVWLMLMVYKGITYSYICILLHIQCNAVTFNLFFPHFRYLLYTTIPGKWSWWWIGDMWKLWKMKRKACRLRISI